MNVHTFVENNKILSKRISDFYEALVEFGKLNPLSREVSMCRIQFINFLKYVTGRDSKEALSFYTFLETYNPDKLRSMLKGNNMYREIAISNFEQIKLDLKPFTDAVKDKIPNVNYKLGIP